MGNGDMPVAWRGNPDLNKNNDSFNSPTTFSQHPFNGYQTLHCKRFCKSDALIITPNDLAEADDFVFGFPTSFGTMAAQFKAFLDATRGLWRTQQLAGKLAGLFYNTGSQGDGQETTTY